MTMVLTNLLLFGAFCVTNTHENRVTSTHDKHVTIYCNNYIFIFYILVSHFFQIKHSQFSVTRVSVCAVSDADKLSINLDIKTIHIIKVST